MLARATQEGLLYFLMKEAPGLFRFLLFSSFIFVITLLFLFSQLYLCHHIVFIVVLLSQGVVAGGVGCGLANYPGVYVRWDSKAGFGLSQISCRDCREGLS